MPFCGGWDQSIEHDVSEPEQTGGCAAAQATAPPEPKREREAKPARVRPDSYERPPHVVPASRQGTCCARDNAGGMGPCDAAMPA
jgi:hypothetical protein